MITNITIKNVVLIEKLQIEFHNGLCALTGETGAGKSILLDSVGLALGNRANSSLIGKSSDSCSVSVSFDLKENHPAYKILEDNEFDEEEAIIIDRTISKDGKSKAFINNRQVSASLLKSIGESLVEIHGQFDNHKLLQPSSHRIMLDEYASLLGTTSELSKLWFNWKKLKEDLKEAEEKARKAKEDEEYLNHVVKELIDLSPEEGEDERLSEIKTKLQNKERIIEALNNTYSCLAGDKSADNLLQKAFRMLDRGTQNSGDLVNPALESIDRALNEVNEAISIIDNICSDMQNEGENLEYIDERLNSLRSAARKHQCSVDDLSNKLEEFKEQLKFINDQGDYLSDLSLQCDRAKKEYIKLANLISNKRKEYALKIDKEIAKELIGLKLEKARFRTEITDKPEDDWNENGIDNVNFMVSTNPNSDFGALNKIASGGEIARFMLALKVVTAETGFSETMIFDEVDTGIGGAVADAVGERLKRLANTKQILVVTHSPQVASRADNHWHISKKEKKNTDRITTSIYSLNDNEERKEEIARMISGATITEEARAAAGKLLQS